MVVRNSSNSGDSCDSNDNISRETSVVVMMVVIDAMVVVGIS